ncbi:acyl-CoA dehydrogenase family protein [Actinomycetospora callitridis]|uniref:acyl-CoA dehydrogenase family protein n=1 Tax=Actinomycetospora callitridis TaxID=913944 RepID=UPI00236730A3|nr:acyl-CoA dehydrogenase family protein [Actinomycetospora callitridis]MDD7918695.1 acyl-CoA/acyl-ACP dehydrogenase [Actinomycetospora callitridis]
MGLDFTLSEEQLQLRAGAREFADGVLTQVAGALDGIPGPEERFYAIRPFFQQMVDAGFLKALIPDEYGGNKFSSLAFTLAAEELARVDINTPTAVLATGLGLQPIIRFGNDEQKARFLPRFVDGTARLAAFGFTEVSGGANWDSPDPKVGVQTFAELDGDEWVINGAKHYVTNGTGWNREGPDTLCLVCRTDPDAPPEQSMAVIVIEKNTPGVEVTGILDTAGHRAVISPRLEFKNVRVPKENILGEPGDGMEIVRETFSWTCAPIGAACIGRMRAAFDYAYQFARTDNRSGPHPVIEYQNAGYMLADLKIRIEAARYLTWKAADHFDKTNGKDRELANITKVFASETSVQVAYDAMRLVGIDAYTDLTPIAGIMNDVLCFPVYDGGNMGVRRRQMHDMFRNPSYDPLALAENRLSTSNPMAEAGL